MVHRRLGDPALSESRRQTTASNLLQTNYFILPENCIPWRGARHCGRSSEDCYRRRPLRMLYLRSLVNFLILCDSPNLAHCHLFIHHLTSDRETCKNGYICIKFPTVSCLSSEHAAGPGRSRGTSESCFKPLGTLCSAEPGTIGKERDQWGRP